MAVQVKLEEGYYLKNFLTLINFIKDRYDFLLHENEREFVSNFNQLSQDGARLYVRLVLRVGPYFRLTKLSYPEITNLEKATEELAEKGFVELNSYESLEDYVHLFTRPELISMAKVLRIKGRLSSMAKDDLVEMYCQIDEDQVVDYITSTDTIILPLGFEVVSCFRLLFFGNLYQDMSEFILEDLGILKFEKYKILEKDLTFRSREVVDQTLALIFESDTLYLAMEERDDQEVLGILDRVDQLKASHESINRKKERLFLKGARFLEKIKNFDLALKYYRKSEIPPSRERQVRIMEKLGQLKEALKLCDKIKSQPYDESEREFLGHFPEKIKKKMDLSYKKSVRSKYQTQVYSLRNDHDKSVEEIVLDYFVSKGFKGFYGENRLWKSLFGLYFWDVVFMSSPGAFFNPFQRGPRDLLSSGFRERRKEEFNQRLLRLKEDWDYTSEILDTYEKKLNTANHLVSWKDLSVDQLKLALRHISREQLFNVFDRIGDDVGKNGSGFPDLIVFMDGNYQLLEVKGPGDQLQTSQKRWLKCFEIWQIPYQVAKVEWA